MTSYIWQDRWVPTDQPPPGFDCADSWRHYRGRAPGVELHRNRFASCAGTVPEGLWESALSLLDASEDLFPRVSVYQGEFRFDIRPAPPARATTDLTLAVASDPRTAPLVKGPDLGRLAEHRRRYAARGTDDVILGDFAETTTGALVGWRGNTLVVPEQIHLPSVTQELVQQRALEMGLPVTRGRIDPGAPVWFLNSLHGVSPVRRVATPDGVVTPPHHPAEEEWRRWWWRPSQR